MKVDYVALSSTCDPYYLDFWPLISKVWKLRFNYTPVLFLIHDDKSVKVSEEYGKVVYFDPLPDIPLHIQAQCSRYWLPVTDENAVWMTSDIDMFPISKQYFINSLQHIPDDKIVSMNARAADLSPCCYIVGKGQSFKQLLNLNLNYEDYVKNIDYKSITYHHTPSNQNKLFEHWGADEAHYNKKVREFKDKTKFVLTTRNGFAPRDTCKFRLDRIYHKYDNFNLKNLHNFIDFHAWRPYSKYKQKIDDIVHQLLQDKV
jgi:hypothetical protein